METVETRVLKSSYSGMKGAKKERKLLEKSSTSYLGPGCREFESRHSDQKSRIRFCGFWTFLFAWCETRKYKCNADERCRRRLDRGEHLSAQCADANESRHSDHLPMESWIHGSIGIFVFSVAIQICLCYNPLRQT